MESSGASRGGELTCCCQATPRCVPYGLGSLPGCGHRVEIPVAIAFPMVHNNNGMGEIERENGSGKEEAQNA